MLEARFEFPELLLECDPCHVTHCKTLSPGLSSLERLDLSHNRILTLGTASLAGLASLTSLSLGHNFLQVVSTSWLHPLANLTQLLLMDNDITSVEEGALDHILHLTEINLAGESAIYNC